MASPDVALPSRTAKEIRKESENVRLPNGGDWKRVSVSGLYFVLRLESGLRLLGAAYRSEAGRSTKRVSRWGVWDPADGC